MKYLMLILIGMVFVSGCSSYDLNGWVTKQLGVMTDINEVRELSNNEYCHPKLERKRVNDDSSVTRLCYNPDELGLVRCSTDQDCFISSSIKVTLISSAILNI